jgi:2-dehydro-3-deoxyphosphogalactonate aldolase
MVLPGTHSKWAQVGKLSEGDPVIEAFRTFMTGEVFSVLKEHSILGKLMTASPEEQHDFHEHVAAKRPIPCGFAHGVRRAVQSSQPGSGANLLSDLFTARTVGLCDPGLPTTQLEPYLSGLLIGHEMAGGLAWENKMTGSSPGGSSQENSAPLVLVGRNALVDLYYEAAKIIKEAAAGGSGLIHAKREIVRVDGDMAACAGLKLVRSARLKLASVGGNVPSSSQRAIPGPDPEARAFKPGSFTAVSSPVPSSQQQPSTTVLLSAALHKCPIVAILRGLPTAHAAEVCDALVAAGIHLIEVPLNSPTPFASVEAMVASLGHSSEVLIGCGTVLTQEQVARVHGSGGTLVVSPNTDLDVIRATKALPGMISLPGCLTPTECFAALGAGADALKIFPAGGLGPGHIKDVSVVLPKHTLVLPVGGISQDNIAQFAAAGASGFGIGGALYKPGDSPDLVFERATAFIKAAAEA